MANNIRNIFSAITGILLLVGCAGMNQGISENRTTIVKIEKTVSEFEGEGAKWGKILLKDKSIKPGDLSKDFVRRINEIDYFQVHSELKDAFKKGFRIGYEDRIADLILGPHIRAAAGDVGVITSGKIVTLVDEFDKSWDATLKRVIDVFIVLVSEGSKADRDLFIQKFNEGYLTKYNQFVAQNTPGFTKQGTTEGGTTYTLPKELAALIMPEPDVIKMEIYHKAFSVMGDEWGRRYSTNLVRREELIDMMRRCKPAMDEVSGDNVKLIFTAFAKSYGTDGDDIIKSIAKDAGFKKI